MRVREGFVPGALPDLSAYLANPADAAEAPGLSRRFAFLDEPGRHGPDSLVVAGAGLRADARAALVDRPPALVLAEVGVALPEFLPVVRVKDARRLLAALAVFVADRVDREPPFPPGADNRVHPAAVVEGVLEGGVTVEAGAYVAAGSFVGRGARVEARAVIREHVVVGRACVIQSGAVIGGAGFGFFAGDRGPELAPHLAGVLVGPDCFIGANTVIAAGVLHPTELGAGCKLDSHVQIAHNVRLGAGSMLASQSGIAGSTVAGANLRMGGAASVAGHLRLGANVSVAAKSGVTKDVADGETVAGFPARPIAQWRREMAMTRSGRIRQG